MQQVFSKIYGHTCTKAKYALNNIAKLKLLPIKTALRLFDAMILPILSYCSEKWAL